MQQPDSPVAGEPQQPATPSDGATVAGESESLGEGNAHGSAAAGPESAIEPERALQAALAKAQENYDLFLRARADGENIRRRAQDDIAKAHKYAIESFAEALVPVMDSLEKALENEAATAAVVREGAAITLRQLQAAFEKNRLIAIDPRGEKFDPHKHQAISMVPAPDGVTPNHVVAVLQKGWLISDRVLRPALVTVAQGS